MQLSLFQTMSLLYLCYGIANPIEPAQALQLPGIYLASEEAGGKSWASFTYKLTLYENGTAEFYQQNVADGDTDSTYNHIGKWDFQDGLVDFKASSRFGKNNWESEQTSESCARHRFKLLPEGDLAELSSANDVKTYVIGFSEGSAPAILKRQPPSKT
uniref:Uncharacterized protein n=1 Tax=Cryptomonas curvata TaxID=233186 RepID=A0A7S0MEP6_9CRYP|mmetsp:Transcript_36262/g.75811  ORF Transcript_36262/g.75811 Transcript_36262/m.75811 type:complete len:158 (+) Transcript_36262:47-520(+)